MSLHNFLQERELTYNEEDQTYFSQFEDFESHLFFLQSSIGYLWLIDIIAVDKRRDDGHFELIYQLFCCENFKKINLKINISQNQTVKSISHIWLNAQVFEQEVYECFGIEFSKNYEKLYFQENDNRFPLRRDCSSFPESKLVSKASDIQIKLRDSLKHNLTILNTNIKSNKVSHCSVEPGMYHLGLEKMLEKKSFKDLFPTVESSFSCSSLTWSFLLARGIESHLGIDIPNRAKALRMIFLELNRVVDHLKFINSLCIELQSQLLYKKSLIWLKRLQSLAVSYCGNEFLFNIMTPGGVMLDPDQVWQSKINDEVTLLEKQVFEEYISIKNDDFWKMNLSLDLGDKSLATNWGVTGPLARALGINLDYRKLDPFYFYQDVNFDVPIGTRGKTFDLFIVKFEEIFQSFKIIIQVLDNLPTGSIIASEVENYVLQQQDSLKDLNEDKYRASILNFNKYKDIKLQEHFEGSNGIQGISLFQKGETIERVKITSPSNILKNYFERISLGQEVSSMSTLWSSLDINMVEVER